MPSGRSTRASSLAAMGSSSSVRWIHAKSTTAAASDDDANGRAVSEPAAAGTALRCAGQRGHRGREVHGDRRQAELAEVAGDVPGPGPEVGDDARRRVEPRQLREGGEQRPLQGTVVELPVDGVCVALGHHVVRAPDPTAHAADRTPPTVTPTGPFRPARTLAPCSTTRWSPPSSNRHLLVWRQHRWSAPVRPAGCVTPSSRSPCTPCGPAAPTSGWPDLGLDFLGGYVWGRAAALGRARRRRRRRVVRRVRAGDAHRDVRAGAGGVRA